MAFPTTRLSGWETEKFSDCPYDSPVGGKRRYGYVGGKEGQEAKWRGGVSVGELNYLQGLLQISFWTDLLFNKKNTGLAALRGGKMMQRKSRLEGQKFSGPKS